jgi:hypothetical protein
MAYNGGVFMIFKKSKEETATEKQIREVDEFIEATEPTSDEYPELMDKKAKLLEIQKLEAEVNKTNAEAKGIFKVDKTAVMKILGVAALALLSSSMENGSLKSANWLCKTKDKFI